MEVVNAVTEGENVSLLYRTPEGVLKRKSVPAPYVSYHRASDLTSLIRNSLRRSPFVLGVTEEGEWSRVQWANFEARKSGVAPQGYFGSLDIKSFEGDVHPIRRLFSDHDDLTVAKPRRLYFDIETDSRVSFDRKEEMRVLTWALVDANEKVFSGVLKEDTDEAEADLLCEMYRVMMDYDQIIAWSGDRFDFPVVQARAMRSGVFSRLGIRDLRRWLYLDHLVLFKRQNTSSESGEEKQSYKLDDIANAILKQGKNPFDSSKTWQAWEAGGKQREDLLAYNVQDAVLLKRIEEKTGYIALFQTLCEVCKIFPETRSLNPTVQADGYMLSLGKKKGYHFPTRYFEEVPEDKYPGAYVQEPTERGIVKGVHVGDFKSLYPSIIITWNMSPETKGGRLANGQPLPEGYARSPGTNLTFAQTDGAILPLAVGELLRLRAEWSDKKAALPPGTPEAKEADRRSTAYKVAANSFYGVVGSPYSRYYDRDIAEAITQVGAHLIKRTMKVAEEKGMKSIYGDTDSVFIRGVSEDEFKQFVKDCNQKLYPQITADCARNIISLAYEKEFERIVFTSAKRYAGRYAHYKGTRAKADSEPEIKGLEYKRGDVPLLARKFQKRVIDLLCKERVEDPAIFASLVDKARDWVMTSKFSVEQVRVSKALSKPLDDYLTKAKLDGTQGEDLAHIKVGKILRDRGEDITQGTRIFYIVADASVSPIKVIPASDFTGEFDRYYLWEKLIYPATMRLLVCAFPDKEELFDRFSKARPSHKRVKPAPPEQTSLGLDLSLPPPKEREELSSPFDAALSSVSILMPSALKRSMGLAVAPMASTKPYVVRLTARHHINAIAELKAMFVEYPGAREVYLEIEENGQTASLALPFRVKVSLPLVEKVKRILEKNLTAALA